MEVGGHSNKNSPPPVHVEVPEYKSQKMNVNQIKDKIGKEEKIFTVQNNLDGILLAYSK